MSTEADHTASDAAPSPQAANDVMPVVACESVSFSFGPMPVLEDVTLQILPRDFVSVVGPNGGGKTTLLRLILGLLKPERGTIRVFGRSPTAARRRIGYMPQHAHLDLKFPVTALDVVLMGRLGTGLALGPFRRADREAAIQALEEVELADCGNRAFAQLSGGQRQRVLIARALASGPELLLLDEPTSNLDMHVEGEFFDLLRRLNERLTILLVSHDLGFVSQYVRTVVCVNRQVQVHATSEITGERINEIYGGDMHMVMHHHG